MTCRSVLCVLWACIVWGAMVGASPRNLGNRPPVLLRVIQGPGSFLGITPDQKTLITMDRYGSVVLLDKVTGRERATWVTGGQVDALQHRAGRLYLFYRDRTLSIRDALTGDEVRSMGVRLDGDTPHFLAVPPDTGRILVAGYDSLALIDLKSGKSRWLLKGVTYPFALSPDGREIVAMSKRDVKVVALASGAVTRQLPMCHPYAFSPDGKRILVSFAQNPAVLVLCNATTGRKLRSFDLGGDCVAAAFSPNGRFLLTGHMYNTAALWDTATGRKIASYNGHELGSVYPITGVAFSSDGRTFAIGFYEGDIRQYRLQ